MVSKEDGEAARKLLESLAGNPLPEDPRNVVYRVVEPGGEYRYSGYRNATGLYSTLKGARQQKTREGKDWRGEPSGKVLKIQRARLVWEDVE